MSPRLLAYALTTLTLTATPLTSADAHAATARLHAPTVTWMSGTTIHVAGGKVIHVKAKRSEGTALRLLGRTPEGWAVDGGQHVLVVAPSGKVLRSIDKDVSDEYAEEVLSDDGRHMLAYVSDQASDRETVVYDTRTGRSVDREDIYEGGDLKMYRNKIYAGIGGILQVRTLGSTKKKTLATHTAPLIDTVHDLVFLGDGKGGTGPTSLSDPGTPAWSQRFLPRSVSPDATYVVGQVGLDHLAIRRMTDGTLVRTLPLTWDDGHSDNVLHGDALGWEDEATVLVGVRAKHGRQALERCDVTSAAACVRLTPWTNTYVTLPTPFHA